jgi:3-hydroxyisobutyrate dehydrogenase-like beta-hydroxyacid dehydrogenase
MKRHTIGWIGTGRMGFPMAERLLKAGCGVTVYNRTRSKAEPLARLGATLAAAPAELARCEIVFSMVAASDDLKAVMLGANGLLTRKGSAPKILVDSSTVSAEASQDVRAAAARLGARMLAAPVSGNGKVVKAGKLTLAVSGPRDAYDEALPYLSAIGPGVTYVGDGEIARTVKICHNVFLAIVAQSLAEVTILAQKSGVPRHAFLDFINQSVMGSVFSRYKTPQYVNLDFAPFFTSALLRKDVELGLAAARALDVPMPLAAAVRELLQALIGNGFAESDFAALIEMQARGAGMKIAPENVPVSDGLES